MPSTIDTTLHTPATPSARPGVPRGDLALALQECFTVVVRLRGGRQVGADAVSFRAHVKQLLAAADQRARAAGYGAQTVKLAVYAYIALLDESILNSAQPMFAEWPRQPLQEEVFGEHMAGENFFRSLQELLAAQDSQEVADVLEVFELCLLLGFNGRYAGSDPAQLEAIAGSVRAKRLRIRGSADDSLVPDWALPVDEKVAHAHDPWARRLMVTAAGLLVTAIVLWVLYRVLLGGATAALQELG